MLLSTIILAKPYKDYTEFDVLPVLKHREDVKYKLLEIPSVNALIHAFIRGYVDWNPLVLGDGMSIRFDATNVRIYFYDESSYDRVDGLHVNVNHEELPVFEYAGMPPSEAAKKIWNRIEELVAIWLSTAGWIADTVPLLSPGCTVE